MKITEAFDVLKQHGHVLDQYNFDNRWLGNNAGILLIPNQPAVSPASRH